MPADERTLLMAERIAVVWGIVRVPLGWLSAGEDSGGVAEDERTCWEQETLAMVKRTLSGVGYLSLTCFLAGQCLIRSQWKY